jgi:hypothetical protein
MGDSTAVQRRFEILVERTELHVERTTSLKVGISVRRLCCPSSETYHMDRTHLFCSLTQHIVPLGPG